MSTAPLQKSPDAVAHLAARVRQMQGERVARTPLEVLPALRDLVPGRLRTGAAYAIRGSSRASRFSSGSSSLAMALLAGVSAAGSWCAVIGSTTFGAEAAAAVGVDLGRTILVPEPRDAWVAATAAFVDVLPIALLAAPPVVHDRDAARLAARLRQHGSTLVVLDEHRSWPRPEVRFEVTDSVWSGVGRGHGHLTGREFTVAAHGKWGRPHVSRMRLRGSGVEAAPLESVPAERTEWAS